LTGALLLGVGQAGAAVLSVSGSVGGAPTGITYVNFDNLSLGSGGGTSGGVAVSFSPDAQVVTGAVGGQYAAPFISNSNGVLFGDATVAGADATKYLTSGSDGHTAGAQVVLVFPEAEKYMGLLWGSIDLYNTLSFYSGATLLGTVTGGDVLAGANGDQGVNGTLYVNINSDTPFDTVIATSSQYAFEFDNVSYNVENQTGLETPLPASAWLFGSVLAGSGLFFGRRRKRQPAAAA
jgi:LPXTG-motif cell wall-anchored protein